jgi:hypothetical protein
MNGADTAQSPTPLRLHRQFEKRWALLKWR